MAYPWKDNVHIFHLAPSFLKSSHRFSFDDFLKKVASSVTYSPKIKKYLQLFRTLRPTTAVGQKALALDKRRYSTVLGTFAK